MTLRSTHYCVYFHRFYLVEKIKDCSRIGVLVGTLGVSRYRDIIDRVINSIQGSHSIEFSALEKKHPNVQGQVGLGCPTPMSMFSVVTSGK